MSMIVKAIYYGFGMLGGLLLIVFILMCFTHAGPSSNNTTCAIIGIGCLFGFAVCQLLDGILQSLNRK